MNFTYDAYRGMVSLLRDMGYPIVGYREGLSMERCAVLRHDVDTTLDKAVQMAEVEAGIGVRSTYFILLTTELYNVASKSGRKAVERILNCGHDIGLHFDETLYPDADNETLARKVKKEADTLAQLCSCEIEAISMHRPSHRMLEGSFHVPGLINVYGKTFFKDYKRLKKEISEPII